MTAFARSLDGTSEFSTKYVLGSETGDAAWEKWLKQAEDLGATKLIEVYNQAQARYDAL